MKKVIVIIIVLIFILLIPLCLFSQHEGKARLKGFVTDSQGKPMAGVKVKLYSHRAGSGFEIKTDKSGHWKAMWIRGGKWDIDFIKPGFETKRISTNLKEDSKIMMIDASLKPVKGPAIEKDMVKEFEKGNKLFEQGKVDEALKEFKAIVTKFPASTGIYLNIGNCYFEKQLYSDAINSYQKVLDNDPENSAAILSTGNCFSNMKQPEKALNWYKKIKVEQINDHVVLYNIGVFNFNAGKASVALRFFKRSIAVKGDFKDGWYQLAMCYMSAGNNKEAITAFNTYLKYDPTSEKGQQVQEILKAIKQQ